ncbi:MAG TPA: hypothetical protein VM619_00495 [Luteimonas sp.]|nr:hypothetical protein [Luteimonas sp.]
MKPASDNPRGFWESREIVAFHERLLASIGSAWSDWSEIDEASLRSADVAAQVALLPGLIEQEFGDARLFFVKDPRMCRFPGVWLDALVRKGIEAKAVIPIRHPAEVASSLESRNRLGMIRSRLIWLRHVLDAEHATRGIRRTFVPYADLLASWQDEVERMAVDLALEWPVPPAEARPRVEEFLHAGLRHFSGEVDDADSRLDGWVNSAYASLRELAREEAPGAMQRLDDIRREFNLAASLFAPAFRESESAHAEAMTGLRRQLDARPAAPVPSAAEIVAGMNQKLAELESRLKAEQQAGISRIAEAAKAENVAHRSEVARLAQSMEAERATHRGEIAELAESMRMDAERHGAALAALAGELKTRRQLAEDLESRLRGRGEELAALRRRFEQSNELYRQESAKRKAINVELERTVAEQNAVLESHANKIRADKRAIGDLRQELDQLGSSHARDRAALQEEIARQQRRAEALVGELDLVHNSRGWKFLGLLRRALGRRAGVPLDEPADAEAIESSGLFDRQWYLDRYPDVAKDGVDPVEHYLRFGVAEMRNPNPGFDTRGYLDRYPDVKAAGLNPLLHYIRFGRREGRDSGPGESR